MPALSRLAFVLLAFTVLPGLATAADYKFHLYNKTTKYTIKGFQTYENEKWSTWTGVALAPGEDQNMNWGANEGSCTVPFRIVYEEIQTEQYSVDWCKVKNIYVTDDNVTYD
jgi:hypothetical protein